MSASDDSTRPLSVADLLARNGTIGAPPVGGRRRKRRRNSDGVSVAELTGEIPVIRTGEIPVVGSVESSDEVLDEVLDGSADEEDEWEDAEESAAADDTVVHYADARDTVYQEAAAEPDEDTVSDEAVAAEDTITEVYKEPAAVSSETVVVYASAEVPEYAGEYLAEEDAEYVTEEDAPAAVETAVVETAVIEAVAVEAEPVEPVEAVEAETPPLAGDPLPRRSDGPELSYDPRPVRRSSGAEQMAYDPVDESVNLDELVDEHVEDVEQLRSYLRASQDTLFSGGTVADDLARRGVDGDGDGCETDQAVATVAGPARPQRPGSALWHGVLAVVQSLLAVVLGAALFIGFDQLWRWNNLVALLLSVLVVLTLAAGVRYVRKTEDIVSTLTAVAVGLLVTLGPLALQST